MLISFIACLALAAAPEDLNVLPAKIGERPTKQIFMQRLQDEAATAFARRAKAYDALKSPGDIAAYQTKLRNFFVEQIGGYPEKTPLNAQMVGRRDGDGFRLEKILFESRPQHYVTALLYLPTTPGPYPGVIVPCGHTADGKIGYFKISALLARNGFAALCYDPIGQGERYQVLDDDGKPKLKSTGEHTAVGVGSILVGRNTASYRIWDGMRAIDYLQSRDDVDGERIGCTGISGGGTLTEYLMCLDDRIDCAAPGCAINTFENRVTKVKMGDAEQNIFGQIAFGLDHADYIHLRAPKPTLLLCATRDFVDIEGSWEIFREAKRVYARLGFSERVDLLEADEEHGFTKPLREQSVRWMRRWLMDRHEPIVEPEIEMPPIEDLLVTPRGQSLLLTDARSVMDLNVEAAEQFAPQREHWKGGASYVGIAALRKRIGDSPIDPPPSITVTRTGKVVRDGYTIEKLSCVRKIAETDVPMPMLLFRPDLKPARNALTLKKPGIEVRVDAGPKEERRVLYLHSAGKHVDATIGGPIEQLVRDGATVLAVDLSGCGEIGRGGPAGVEFNEALLTYLLGKSLVGLRVDDIRIAARQSGGNGPYFVGPPTQVEVVAVGAATIPALHAVAIDPSTYKKLTLREMPIRSWLDVVRDPTLPGSLNYLVHGALLDYDLPDLIHSLPKGMVVIENK